VSANSVFQAMRRTASPLFSAFPPHLAPWGNRLPPAGVETLATLARATPVALLFPFALRVQPANGYHFLFTLRRETSGPAIMLCGLAHRQISPSSEHGGEVDLSRMVALGQSPYHVCWNNLPLPGVEAGGDHPSSLSCAQLFIGGSGFFFPGEHPTSFAQ